MKINKIKIGLIIGIVCLGQSKIGATSAPCFGSKAFSSAVKDVECVTMLTGIAIAGIGVLQAANDAISDYYLRASGSTQALDLQSIYQQGVAEYKATGVLNPSPEDLNNAGGLKVIDAVTSALDTNLGYSPGTAGQFFDNAFTDNPSFSFVDVVNFASNAVQTLGTTTVNGTKITLPEAGQYKNFDDYIIRNGITNTGKLTDLITQASARGSDGLLPQVYEPSEPSGPSGPSTPVGPKITNTEYQQLQEIYQQSQLRLNQDILNIQDVTARTAAIDSLKAQIQADLSSAEEGSADQAKAQGELEAFKESFPDVEPPVDV